ncbi:MAG: translation initiation factor [Paludibacteraceae bacterium]|nr:translation initiation factor [Paludibacteraceae bacterium]
MEDWKSKLSFAYSTNPNFNTEEEEEIITPEPKEQKLYIELDKRNRSGKSVTLITGFIGKEEDLKELAKKLKSKCGVGGSAKDGEIIIQGDFREKIDNLLTEMGYKTKRKN